MLWLLDWAPEDVHDALVALVRAQQRELGGHVNVLVVALRGQCERTWLAALVWALGALAKIMPARPMRAWLPSVPPERERDARAFVLALRKPAELWTQCPEYTLDAFLAEARRLAAFV